MNTQDENKVLYNEEKSNTNIYSLNNETYILQSFIKNQLEKLENMLLNLNNSSELFDSESHLESKSSKNVRLIIEAIAIANDNYSVQYTKILSDKLKLLIESWLYQKTLLDMKQVLTFH